MVSATVYAVGNVLSSVALVLLNKRVFAGGFAFPMALSGFHFCFTVVWYALLEMVGVYSKPSSPIPLGEKFKVALAGFASIGFMNLSLTYNSVGFYQVTKLTIIPVTLLINAIAYGIFTTAKIKISLAILLGGVGIATVTDVELRPLGMSFGVAAVLSTAVFQIWQGTKQKDFGVSATQLQAGIAGWQSIQAFAVAAIAETTCSEPGCVTVLEYFQRALFGDDAEKLHTLGLVLGTCFLALAVNLCSFGLIGRTSPTTFQVVGHLKTCLVLTGGYVFFPAKLNDSQQLYNNILGVSVAMVGCVLYGHLKDAASQEKPDCLDCVCPGPVLSVIEPRYSAVVSEETEGLKAAPDSRPGS